MSETDKDRVLVIEDDSFHLKRLENILAEAHISFTSFNNGKEAITEILNNSEKYSCILSDIHMDVFNGFDVINLIKKSKKKIPIIFITADDKIETKAKAEVIGIFEYLVKPYSKDVLIHAINKAFQKFKSQK
ncbi:MAG: response regulator [Spirochaetes bacterium]|nr:response regulator [Spirochaetota bacterium]